MRVTATLDGAGVRALAPDGNGAWYCRFDDVAYGLRVLAITTTSANGATDTDTIEDLALNAR